jgi:SPP1 gp7 family putative phage head morphogenesis protein
MFATDPIPNEDAAALIASKPVFKREAFKALLPELRARAFTLTAIDSADIMQTVRGMLAEVPRGADWKETRQNIAAELMKEWGGLAGSEEELAKAMSRAMIRAEFTLRLHAFQAYQAGRWDTMQRQKRVFPYWQYVAFGDNRVRPTHQALDGLILPADDPFWKDHYPPWEWGCRCMVRAISKADYREELARDAARPADQRRVLPPEREQAMKDSGQLTRNGQTVDVRSPRAKALAKGEDGLDAFGWDPSTLRLPLKDIEARYADTPEVVSTFRTWAGKEVFDGTRSVLDWLEGKPA